MSSGGTSPGGGATPTLAQVLVKGADTGRTTIVSVPAADADANVNRTATASGDGGASANSTASGAGEGNASATVLANATDGQADVSRSSQSATWRADANTSAAGGANARANTDATSTGAGNAECQNKAIVNGAGTALATLSAAGDSEDVHLAKIECSATASGQSIAITGLPITNPGVGNKLWNDGGTLKITAAA